MINIAIVGSGGMGSVHYYNFLKIKTCQVVAIIGASLKDEQKAQEWNLKYYKSISDCVKDINVDVIDICTPTFLHYNHVMEALQHKKQVICEKPLTLKLKDAKNIFDCARKNGCNIYVGHVVQFMPQTKILRELVASNKYGKVLDGDFERLSASPDWAVGGWLFDKSKSGLIPFDLHIHDLDLIISLFGRPDSYSFTKNGKDINNAEYYRFMYSYKDMNIVAEAGWLKACIPFTTSWKIYFEKGYLVNSNNSLKLYKDDGEIIQFDIEEKEVVSTGINVPPTGMYLSELKHFIDCTSRGIPSNIVSEDQILKTIEILEDINNKT
ncbi:MAG: Gfo/Idh/MocA family protein [Anaerorhabdus sp.]